ncbi:conserved membrane hypothetical protein [Candidatus Desulfarcum epimagneticum]|uniref:Uncharacterized protein n=1 Tax=uncultured Desulfobacteraceae bacterium TaxID=218296 RepID=A0A484HDM2_9BACT|nr:conserved membrane hypothetical protein [uncultured Desulfobacteraceae bacterium]
MGPEKNVNISDYMKQAARESRILISYVARHSSAALDSEAAKTLIRSQYKMERNDWSPEDELRFWNAYDKVASSIKPVSIESLKAALPDPLSDEDDGKKKKSTEAASSVSKYRRLTAVSLVLLLLAQIYWINGSDLTAKIDKLFTRIDAVSLNIDKRKQDKNHADLEHDIEINKLVNEKKALIQEFGAAYQLLQDWNRFWQILIFHKQFEAEITHYARKKYEHDMERIANEISEILVALKTGDMAPDVSKAKRNALERLRFEGKKRTFEQEFDKERNKLFLTRISAEFVIRSLQIYGLPLLYGLLGAIIYTLRSLAVEIKNLTYTRHSETKYRLRITMGLLAGMAIGWFLKPDDLSVAGSLSPMTLAFLAGYNVEALFAVMDKFIEMISKFGPGAQKKPPPAETEKEAGA